jgi:hypothetical protein
LLDAVHLDRAGLRARFAGNSMHGQPMQLSCFVSKNSSG